MRRWLLALAALALVVAGYVTYWYSVAGVVRTGLLDWSAARRAEGLTIGWDRYAVTGFPFLLRVTIEQPIFSQNSAEPGISGRAPVLIGEARPWALGIWRIAAHEGVRLNVQPGPARPAIALEAATLDGTAAPQEAGDAATNPGTEISLAADRITVAAAANVAADHAEARLFIPGRGPASHLDIWRQISFSFARVTLPAAVPPLGDTVDRIAGTLAIKGAIPSGPRRAALASWRDDGGTIEVSGFTLDWGSLALTATGTIALDGQMQPLGGLAATIRGYGEIVDALVAGGSLKPGDGAMAKIGLGLIAKPGPDGKSQLSAPLALQNGFLYIGPARLARLPSFTWE